MYNGYFIFDGKNSKDNSVRLQGPITFSTPVRKIEKVSIPGRSGDLCFFQDAFDNISARVSCFILAKDLAEKESSCSKWLLSKKGYLRLEVSEEPDAYFMARCESIGEYENRNELLGVFDIEFDCYPQRWLKSGESPIHVYSGQILTNQWQPALPLINITGNGDGQLTVGSSTISISGMDGNLTIDSDTQNAYDGATNKNSIISVSGGFPVLDTGETSITWFGDITSIEIIPRWWKL